MIIFAVILVWSVLGFLIGSWMRDWYELAPWIIWRETDVNIFGCILLTIFFNLLCPVITIVYWLDVICTIGRKSEVEYSDNMTKQEYGAWIIQEFIKEIEACTPRGLIENGETDMECIMEAANSLTERLEGK